MGLPLGDYGSAIQSSPTVSGVRVPSKPTAGHSLRKIWVTG